MYTISGSWRSGSAFASHAKGHRFKSCTAHHLEYPHSSRGYFFAVMGRSNTNFLVLQQDLKGAAMFLFVRLSCSSAHKAKTASPACRKISSEILPEGKSCTAHHLKHLLLEVFFILFFDLFDFLSQRRGRVCYTKYKRILYANPKFVAALYSH